MNYISEIKAFYDWLELNEVEASHISVWHGLMHIANKTGWRQEFTVPMSTLELKTGLKRGAIYKARNKLKQLGLIDYRERSGNQCSAYRITSLCLFNEHNSVTIDTQQLHSSTTVDTQSGNINKPNETRLNETIPPNPPQAEGTDGTLNEPDGSKAKKERRGAKKETDTKLNDELNQIFIKETANFPIELLNKVKEWFDYKKQLEKKSAPYVPIGLKSWLDKANDNLQKHGAAAVIEVINYTMLNGYRGVVWDRLDQAKGRDNPIAAGIQQKQKSFSEIVAEAAERGEV